jgi:SAM-dependent methyltransferase
MPHPPYPRRDDLDYKRRRRELPFGMTSRDAASNYFHWLARVFSSYARGRVIDHGAGTGSLVAAIAGASAQEVIALEPDPVLIEVLRDRFQGCPNVRVVSGTLEDYIDGGGEQVDCVLSCNVIEHIADDEACLATMYDVIRPGGSVGLYIPARPELFGTLDEAVGHYRRYTLEEVTSKLRRAGFDVKFASYRNLIAVLPWLVSGRVLKRKSLGFTSITVFDRTVFPLTRWFEDVFPPQYGLNVVAVGVRPK